MLNVYPRQNAYRHKVLTGKRTIAGMIACAVIFVGFAQAQTLSSFGTPGLVDMPSAEVLPDGEIALTTAAHGNTLRNTFTFQMLPRVYGSFRYATIRGLNPGGPQQGNVFDRSFDVHVQLLAETVRRPALAFGLRDFGGTGIYGGEYVVATKTIGPKLTLTGGLGWGRLAQRGGFSNPLGVLSSRFDTRPARQPGQTGQLDAGAWFRGPAAAFGGIEYRFDDKLSFQLEYSSDAYRQEVAQGIATIDNPFNFALRYQLSSGASARAYVIGGREIGAQLSFVFNPANRPVPGGFDLAPPPILPPGQRLLTAERDDTLSATLSHRMATEGLVLQGVRIDGTTATVRFENTRWFNEAQAIGRAARIAANALPASVSKLELITQRRGVPVSTVTLARSDLADLEGDIDGSWRMLARTRIDDATLPAPTTTGFPRFAYGIGPYTAFSFFDPDSPVRADLGAELSAQYQPHPGLTFSGVFRQPVIGNIADATRQSNSVLPRVRSEAVRYARESEFEINSLTAEYLFRPGEDLFGRVTAGYLEPMFGGLSAELLWAPGDSRLALGAEVNYARQRDYDMLFGFQSYDVITGHVSAYYDLGRGFVSQIDMGRYLAGDWGATVSLDREFGNGFSVGGYFTLTDVSSADFGEGSFDKGIRLEIPLNWFNGRPGRETVKQVIQPVLRDGGARLQVNNRLYDLVDAQRAHDLAAGWGRFFR
jgi:hypothetical protein